MRPKQKEIFPHPTFIFQKLKNNREQSKYSAGRDQSARIKRSRTHLALRSLRLFFSALSKPTHQSSGKNRHSSSDTQIRSHRKRQRPYPQQFHGNHQKNS